MSLSIQNPSNNTIAEIRTMQVHGVRGVGSYVLLVRLTMLPTRIQTEVAIRDLQLRLELDERRIIGWSNKDGHGVTKLNEYSGSHDLFFYVQLSAAQISALEKHRAGGDITIQTWLAGNVIEAGQTSDFIDHATFTIPQQQWVTALGEMGFARSLLYEIRFQDSNPNDKDSLEALLRNAWQLLNKGHYSESVGSCRKALELVEQSDNDKGQALAAIQKYKQEREKMSLDERLLFLREAVKNVTQLGVHYAANTDFDRQQAQVILGATVALISHWELESAQ